MNRIYTILDVLKECETALNTIDECKSENKIDQARVILNMTQNHVGELLENKDRSAAERDIVDALLAVSSVIDTLSTALETEHDIIFKTKTIIRKHI